MKTIVQEGSRPRAPRGGMKSRVGLRILCASLLLTAPAGLPAQTQECGPPPSATGDFVEHWSSEVPAAFARDYRANRENFWHGLAANVSMLFFSDDIKDQTDRQRTRWIASISLGYGAYSFLTARSRYRREQARLETEVAKARLADPEARGAQDLAVPEWAVDEFQSYLESANTKRKREKTFGSLLKAGQIGTSLWSASRRDNQRDDGEIEGERMQVRDLTLAGLSAYALVRNWRLRREADAVLRCVAGKPHQD